MKVTNYVTKTHPTIESLEKILTASLGDKYKFTQRKKATSIAGKLVNGSAGDSITVIKNAYHRSVIHLTELKDERSESGKYTAINFSEDTMAGWLSFLRKEAGFLGQIILRLIYGKGDDFYKEVENAVKSNIEGEDVTEEFGLSALFKKKS